MVITYPFEPLLFSLLIYGKEKSNQIQIVYIYLKQGNELDREYGINTTHEVHHPLSPE